MKLAQLQEARTLQPKYVDLVISTGARTERNDVIIPVDPKDEEKAIEQLKNAFGPGDEGSYDHQYEGRRLYRYVWTTRVKDRELTIQLDNEVGDYEPEIYIEVTAGS